MIRRSSSKGTGGERDDDAGLSPGGGFDAAGGFMTIHHWHPHIHPDEVRCPFSPNFTVIRMDQIGDFVKMYYGVLFWGIAEVVPPVVVHHLFSSAQVEVPEAQPRALDGKL